jgi:ankyrin repeat protein
MVKRKIEEELGPNKKTKYSDNLSIFSDDLSEVTTIFDLSIAYAGINYHIKNDTNETQKEDLQKYLAGIIDYFIKNNYQITFQDIDNAISQLPENLAIKIINSINNDIEENENINLALNDRCTTEILTSLVKKGFSVPKDSIVHLMNQKMDDNVLEKIRYIYSLNLKHKNLSEDNTENLIQYIQDKIFQDPDKINANYIKYRMYLKYMDNKCKSSLVNDLDTKIKSIEIFKTINKTIETSDANQLIEQYEQDQNSFSGMPFALFFNLESLSENFFEDIGEEKLLNMLENDLFPYSDATFVWAAHYGYNDVVKFLLDTENININFKDKDGKTALHYVASTDLTDSLELLEASILAGADVNIQDKRGNTILHILAGNNNINLIKTLISTHKINIDALDKQNNIFAFYLSSDNKKAILLWAKENDNKQLLEIIKPLNIDYSNEYALIHASENGYLNIVNSLMSIKDINVNIKNEHGASPLDCAVYGGHKEIVEALIKADAEVNTQDKNGVSALHCAVYQGHKEIVEALISSDANVNVKDSTDIRPLHCAVSEGHKEIVEALIKAGADLNAQDNTGNTILHILASNNNINLIKTLISTYNINIDALDKQNNIFAFYLSSDNQKAILLWAKENDNKQLLEIIKPLNIDYSNEYALIHASENGYINITNDLLSIEGIDVNIKDEYEVVPLHYAVYGGHKEIVEALIKAGAYVNVQDENGVSTLHYAVSEGHKEIVEALIKAGANLNAQDNTDLRPLHSAVTKGHKEIVEALIKAGADVNVQDKNGVSTLHYAVTKGHKEIVEALIKAGADVNVQNNTDLRPLHSAVTKEIVEALIKAGADVNVQNNTDLRPLHFAVTKGYKEIVEALIKAGADVNVQNKNGVSTLHCAVYPGHKEIVEALIKAGANLNAQDKNGVSTLHYAVIKGHKEIVEALIKAGAEVNVQDNTGKKATDYAKNDEMKQLLSPTKSFVQKLEEEKINQNSHAK